MKLKPFLFSVIISKNILEKVIGGSLKAVLKTKNLNLIAFSVREPLIIFLNIFTDDN